MRMCMLYMQDLNGVRAIEKDLRDVMAKTADPREKNELTREIGRIEILKGELKNKNMSR